MERKENPLRALSDAEYDIMDQLYFMAPFENIQLPEGHAESDLKHLLVRMSLDGFLDQMYYDRGRFDFIRVLEIDREHPEKYNYLVTKRGLKTHNSIKNQ